MVALSDMQLCAFMRLDKAGGKVDRSGPDQVCMLKCCRNGVVVVVVVVVVAR